jgi:putative addiction module component (TIGR02574 family)
MATSTVAGIIKQALKQPEKERARIAETLISSLDHTPDADVELAWQEEIGKRLKEIDSGKVKCIPWEDVRNRLYENARTQH